jgi:hypothetical protein
MYGGGFRTDYDYESILARSQPQSFQPRRSLTIGILAPGIYLYDGISHDGGMYKRR